MTIACWRPRVLAVVGLGAYRVAFGDPRAGVGPQRARLEGARLWALPNPSGLNAHYPLAEMARLYRAAARDAGLRLLPAS